MGAEEKILKDRAVRLSARKEIATRAQVDEPILVFKLGAERFALSMSLVQTILPFARVTPVALTSAEVLGVTAHKGEVHSVYDLAKLLQLTAVPPGTDAASSACRIVILRAGKHNPGVRVDQIESIDFLDANRPAPSTARTFVKPRHSDALILIENLDILSNATLDGE